MKQFILPLIKGAQRPTAILPNFHHLIAMLDTGAVLPVWVEDEELLKNIGGVPIAFNQPFDDISQERIQMEANAIFAIIARTLLSENDIILSSNVLAVEIMKNPNKQKMSKSLTLYQAAKEKIEHSEAIEIRAKQLQEAGFHIMDSLHVATAEIGQADIFFTVDDKLLKTCKKTTLKVQAINPVDFIKEVLKNES